MGQKVNPHGLRVGVIKDWDSRWFVKDEVFGDTLVSDYKLRKFLKEKLKQAGVPKIEIERDNAKIRVVLHCAKPASSSARAAPKSKSSARRSKPSSASLPASTWSRLSSPTSTRSSSPKAFPRSWKSALRSAAR